MKRDAALLQLEINRHLSSAYHVIRTSGRVIRMGEDKRGEHMVRRQAARNYWRTWVKDHADDVSLLVHMKSLIRTMQSDGVTEVLIAAAIGPTMHSQVDSSAEPGSLRGPVVPTQPILLGKRLTNLLHLFVAAGGAQF